MMGPSVSSVLMSSLEPAHSPRDVLKAATRVRAGLARNATMLKRGSTIG